MIQPEAPRVNIAPADISPAAQCWFLTGPTAAGKTQVGLELAERLGAEILSLDSMAVYRGLDIGAAKPTAAERARVPHHLLDLVEPTAEFSVAEYLAAARARAAEVLGRGRQALFVGGTPLYLKALLRGLDDGPPADWEFRRQVLEEMESVGVEALHERLRLVDPLAAAKLHPRDARRIIRALEVCKLTGQPLSHRQTRFEEALPAEACRVFMLEWPRPELHRRINARVERMFAAGWVDEARGLLARHGALGRTAAQAVGYREIFEYLQAGGAPPHDLATVIERVRARTRQFARRQETWFRGLGEIRRVPQTSAATPAEAAEQVLRLAAK